MRWDFLVAGLLVGLAGNAHAHVGDQLFRIFELTDEELRQIDLGDGSVEDWENVFGDPTMAAVDFPIDLNSPESEYDPSDIDFLIWLGWNQGTSRIYVAVESTDNDYFNEYEELKGLNFMTYYDSIQLMIDGDHSGGSYNARAHRRRASEANEGTAAPRRRPVLRVVIPLSHRTLGQTTHLGNSDESPASSSARWRREDNCKVEAHCLIYS